MKQKLGGLMLGIIVCLLFSAPSYAKEPEFELDIDNTKLQPGASAQLTLTIKNAKGAAKPEVKGLDNFEVLSQGSSTQTQIINFETTYIKKYHYKIMPQERGEFSLQGIVDYEGQEYRTNQLEVEVAKESRAEKQKRGKLFIETELEKDRVYFGEEVVLSYNLFSRYNIQDYGFKEGPDFDNFMSEKIKQDQLEASYVRINGKKYIKYEVAKIILTPTKTGELKIPRLNFQANISSGDFFNSVQAKYLQTEPKEIEVLSLPQQGQPDNFSGLVGDLKLRGDLGADKVQYGDSISWQIKALGNCNLDNLEELLPTEQKGLEIYQSEKESQEEIRDGESYNQKEFEVILVPQQGGEIKLPTIEIPYFNPKTESYEWARLEGEKIQVLGGSKEDSSQSTTKETGVDKEADLERVEISQIQVNDASDEYYTLKVKKDYLVWALIIVSSLVLLIVIIFVIKKYREPKDDRLKNLYQELKEVDSEDELYEALNRLLKAKYDLSLKADTKAEIEEKIADQEIVEAVIEIMDYRAQRRYGAGEESMDLEEKIKKFSKI
ncbi:MAG: BatD family protein [Halanaerobacter sp.]